MNTTSSRSVLAKIFRDLKPGDTTWTADAVEWMGEALDFMGYGAALIAKTVTLPLVSYRCQLPSDFAEIIGVELNGARLQSSLDSRPFSDTNADNGSSDTGYYLAGAGTKTLVCSADDTDLTISYYSYPVDDKNYPLIPDTIYYKQAIQWYVMRQMMLSGYVHPLFSWADCDREWKHYCVAAQNDAMMPNVEKVEQTYRSWVQLLPDRDRYSRFFTANDLVDTNTSNIFTGGVTTVPDHHIEVPTVNPGNNTGGGFSTVTLAATVDHSLVMTATLPVTPAGMPIVYLGVYQDVGSKTNSLYFSSDNGVTANLSPKIGDKLYVNPTILGCTVDAGEEITLTY